MKDIESFEDSDQVGDAVHLVGIENLGFRVLLHFEVGTVGHAAQQFANLFAAQLPALPAGRRTTAGRPAGRRPRSISRSRPR